MAISHQDRFLNKKLLFVTGERAEESRTRANYNTFEIHKMDNREGIRRKRIVDAWRPVHKWKIADVWKIIERWKINPHPCYQLGWGRCSCACCIFSSKDQIATLRIIQPEAFTNVLNFEKMLDQSIHYKKHGKEYSKIFLDEYANQGHSYEEMSPHLIKLINSEEFTDPIFLENWILPKGAFADQIGPE